MEHVLDLYRQPYDPQHPQVCMDETSKQLVSEVAQPIPVEPGHPARFDYEYERQGVANLFILFEPLRGWRSIKVTERRTRRDWALLMKELVDVHYPLADNIRLVMDNLNTHIAGALYETFEPMEAKRILDKIEFHYTPKHGSWLNMAEIELSVLSRQCLDQRIGERETLVHEIDAWQKERNDPSHKMDWRFTTADARIKLKRLYPSINK
jgi:hypothetical protein